MTAPPRALRPELDLSAIQRPCAPLPWRVADVVVEGLDPGVEREIERGYFAAAYDDEDPESRRSVFRVGAREHSVRRMREAWHLAVERGLVPRGWLDEPRRVFPDQRFAFFCADCGGMGATGYNYDNVCDTCGGRGSETVRSFVPLPTCATSAWMLACPELVEEAESLARLAVQRVAGSADRVQWGRKREWFPGRIPLVLSSAIAQRGRPAGEWDGRALEGPAFEDAAWWPIARGLDAPTREMLVRDVAYAWIHRAAGDTSSAYEPLLRLWELGIVVEELIDDRVVLDRACARPRVPSWRAGVPYA